MKYVRVVAPVQIVGRDGSPAKDLVDGKPVLAKPYTMHRFVLDYICTSPHIGKGLDGLRRVQKLDYGFENVNVGELVGIEDADYAVAMSILNELEWAHPLIGVQLLRMLEEWEAGEKQTEEWKRKTMVKAVGEEQP